MAISKALETFAMDRRRDKGSTVVALTIPLNPVPASRPRISRFGRHAYYSKTYAQWKRQAALYLPSHPEFPVWSDKRTPLLIVTEFIIKKARTSKLVAPIGDLDNYSKAAWDAVTKCGSVWQDDTQVVNAAELKRFANPEEEPRTELLIVEI